MTSKVDSGVEIRWWIKIPLRNGLHLGGTLYTPRQQNATVPCLITLTCYINDHIHDRAVYFASRGTPFLAVDVRGRGNSEGEFQPFVHDAQDGYDAVEWLARQPCCNGQVGMYGGSYLAYTQWATAKESPPHLATIVPTAAPYVGIDAPMRNNIFSPYYIRWLLLVGGRASQQKAFADNAYWSSLCRRHHESGRPFRETDVSFGTPSPIFQEWVQHPELDSYWDSQNPTAEEYARLRLPILTITGIYDGDQPGALEHYKQHMRHAPPAERARHYLVIGPWNHAGCGLPSAEFDGIKVGAASLIDMYQLHREWYAWTMQGGPKPEFLKDRVAYYVMVADRWRYAPTLEEVTARSSPLYLHSTCNPTDVFSSGSLSAELPEDDPPDQYIYDPRDIHLAELESQIEETVLTDQWMVHASRGSALIYHTEPFEADLEISGFFRFAAWLGIDQPDTDFRVRISEIDPNGGSVELTTDCMRARYRRSLRAPELVRTSEALLYEFDHFTFVARVIRRGHRLRLVIGCLSSIYEEKNFNGGGVVAEEFSEHARTVTVRLFHDAEHPSALYIPWGHLDSSGNP